MYTFQRENADLVHIASSHKPYAAAYVRGSEVYPDVAGRILFYPAGERGVLVVSNVRGLPISPEKCSYGIFAMHIHENGTCKDGATDAFLSAGGHYNPEVCPHPAHAGDLPPLFATEHGKAWNCILTDRFGLAEIIGRSVIIHRNPDDFKTQPAGNAGERIACGTIVKAIRGR
ncbi:MAG: superoxide dismutase family protein [Candidatus Fimenecus sp.]